ncbi:MAG: hypothetical protein D6761_02965 [Candidatus Dadabacteria bacterium]|nr:MAG: hypothetical protein D6761_02965 [Candidatus Dadabacteria bacterium]
MNRVLWALVVLMLPACGGGQAGAEPVAAMDKWQRVEAAEDPFSAQRESWHYCDPGGIGTEVGHDGTTLEVDTGLCNFATVRQPLKAALGAGDTLQLDLWHGVLDAPEVATATVIVATEEALLLQGAFPIPSASGQASLTGAVGADIPVGTFVYLHLNNHGDNAWTFLALEKR